MPGGDVVATRERPVPVAVHVAVAILIEPVGVGEQRKQALSGYGKTIVHLILLRRVDGGPGASPAALVHSTFCVAAILQARWRSKRDPLPVAASAFRLPPSTPATMHEAGV